jgi:hypothetical protein
MNESPEGRVVWKSWSFGYMVAGREGLSLFDGFFQGRRVFNKLSLPVIRVKYVKDEVFLSSVWGTACGPYNDQITWDPVDFGEDLNPIAGPHHLVRISDCGDRYICIRETTHDGPPRLELGVYARIGAYHIFQAWLLLDTGELLPLVFSKGLSCNLDHHHHPHWRFDFDLDGANNQRVNVFGGGGTRHLGFMRTEGALRNDPNGGTVFNVEGLTSGMKAWIIPPALDPTKGIVGPTPFCSIDGFVRIFRESEDRDWPHKPNEEMGFAIHGPCDRSNIVFWSVCHLEHHADEGKDHWHFVGPTIKFEIPPPPPPPPGSVRRVRIRGKMHIKDFVLIGTDNWGHFDFDETRILQPAGPHGEVFVERSVHDVMARLLIKLDLRPNNVVAINASAKLFDEGEEVAAGERLEAVGPDRTFNVTGIHLRDHHSGDPDTADMEFTVENGV